MYRYFLFGTGLLLSSVAAVFSVSGLAEMFSAAYWSIVLMASTLEVAKLVIASWLFNRWDHINKVFRVYLTSAVVVLMLITSGGIFGVLSKAFIEKAAPHRESQVQVVELKQKIESAKLQIDRNTKAINQMDSQIDSLVSSGAVDQSLVARQKQRKEREFLQNEIRSQQKIVDELNSTKSSADLENEKATADIGPLKYLAAVFYGEDAPVEKAVRLLIIVLILVFDPLAVILMMSATKEMQIKREEVPKKETIDDIIDKVSETGTIVDIHVEKAAEVEPKGPVTRTYAVSVDEFVPEEPKPEKKPRKPRVKKPKQLDLDLPVSAPDISDEAHYKFNHNKRSDS